MAAGSPCSSFHRFPDLPPELRLEIWRLTLPIHGPRLCFYDHTTWSRRRWHLKESDDKPDLDTMLKDLRIKHHLPPAAQVSHEARAAILKHPACSGNSIECDFDSNRDILYFRWDCFLTMACLSAKLRNSSDDISLEASSGAIRMAVGETTILQLSEEDRNGREYSEDMHDLRDMLQDWHVLYIVRQSSDGGFYGCREINAEHQGRVWSWNVEKRIFDVSLGHGGPNGGSSEATLQNNDQLNTAIENLAKDGQLDEFCGFEIREIDIVELSSNSGDLSSRI